MLRFAVLCALAGATAAREQLSLEAKPAYLKAPKKEWARKPKAAKDGEEDFIVPVVYAPITKRNAVSEKQENGMHVRAGDNRVIVHHDDNSYNADGAYDGGSKKDGKSCCQICPKAEKCDSPTSCYHKCHTMCGNMCEIPKGSQECEIGKDCGFQRPQDISTDQDMVNGKTTGTKNYESQTAPAKEGIKDLPKPKKENARPPLPAKEKPADAPEQAPTEAATEAPKEEEEATEAPKEEKESEEADKPTEEETDEAAADVAEEAVADAGEAVEDDKEAVEDAEKAVEDDEKAEDTADADTAPAEEAEAAPEAAPAQDAAEAPMEEEETEEEAEAPKKNLR